jgi:hypothetical protein
MNGMTRKLRKIDLPSEDPYASSSGEMGLGEGPVIGLLNREQNPGAIRVAELVEAFRQGAQRMDSLKASSGGEQYIVGNALAEINTRLSRFQWSPAVLGFTQPVPHFKVRYVMMSVGKSGYSATAPEEYATQWIVDHVNVVHRIRRCNLAKCRKWFFAKTDHQKYCGDNCRQREAAQGKSFKEKRRLYMKKYRREEAERDARAKRLAKGKTK